jgi:hypothetical protein
MRPAAPVCSGPSLLADAATPGGVSRFWPTLDELSPQVRTRRAFERLSALFPANRTLSQAAQPVNVRFRALVNSGEAAFARERQDRAVKGVR